MCWCTGGSHSLHQDQLQSRQHPGPRPAANRAKRRLVTVVTIRFQSFFISILMLSTSRYRYPCCVSIPQQKLKLYTDLVGFTFSAFDARWGRMKMTGHDRAQVAAHNTVVDDRSHRAGVGRVGAARESDSLATVPHLRCSPEVLGAAPPVTPDMLMQAPSLLGMARKSNDDWAAFRSHSAPSPVLAALMAR